MIELLDALVERLAQIALGEYVDEPEQLEQALAERQNILTALQSVNPSQLPEAERARLKARLEWIRERDEKLLEGLCQLRDELQKAMEQLTYGRAAARGYGNQSDAPTPQVRRIG